MREIEVQVYSGVVKDRIKIENNIVVGEGTRWKTGVMYWAGILLIKGDTCR